MAEKIKSLTLTKAKVAEVDGEHKVTFVASSPNEDRDYERVNISTFRLPVKGGGHIIVSDLPTAGADNVDIPLLLDHDLWTVEKVIGSVRKAFYTNGELVFEAGISNRPIAQEMYMLLSEGHLDNAFSIQYRDCNHDNATNTDNDGEIVEVSLVVRGSNMDARVLAVKSVGNEQGEKAVEEKPQEITPAVENTEEIKVEDDAEAVKVETDAEAKAEAEMVEQSAETVAEEVAIEDAEANENVDAEAEDEVETDNGEAETEAEDNNNNKEENAMENIAKSQVMEKASQAKAVDTDYLKSKTAEKDFADTIIKMKGASSQQIMKAWGETLKEKGIGGDAILPSRIEQIFFKTWLDETSPLSTFRTIRTSASALNAFTGEGEGIRAKGHKKGEIKANQVVENLRRDLKAKLIYKKLPIDLQDLIDDQTGELTAFRAEELAQRVLSEIVRGAIVGDGRSEGETDYRVFDGTRGLFSMAADIDTAATAPSESDTNAIKYARAVASVVADTANTDNLYDKIVKTVANVRDKGYGKSIALNEGAIAQLRLTKGTDGHYIFPVGSDIEGALNVRVFEVDYMSASGYDVIAWANQGYALFATEEMVRTSFDINTNEDIMLVERAVAGSLYGSKSCAGYPTTASA